MPGLYEIFEREDMRISARRQGARLTALLAILLSATVIILSPIGEGLAPGEVMFILFPCAWAAMAYYTTRQVRSLNRTVCCVKVCDAGVIGYDYASRETSLPWDRVRRIELSRVGLTLVGSQSTTLTIPTDITDFPRLSHRIADQADKIGVPIFIDRQPWQNVDVYALFPILAEQGCVRSTH